MGGVPRRRDTPVLWIVRVCNILVDRKLQEPVGLMYGIMSAALCCAADRLQAEASTISKSLLSHDNKYIFASWDYKSKLRVGAVCL